MMTTVWLIERPNDDQSQLRWWNPSVGWVRDAEQAVWFARQEDAVATIQSSALKAQAAPASHHTTAEDAVSPSTLARYQAALADIAALRRPALSGKDAEELRRTAQIALGQLDQLHRTAAA